MVQAKEWERFVNERTCPYPEKFCHAAIRRCTPDFARSREFHNVEFVKFYYSQKI